MRLTDLQHESGDRPLDLNSISADGELARDIQGRLALAGLLDLPTDGMFGSVSLWALRVFAQKRQLPFSNVLNPGLVTALLADDIAATFPMVLGNDLASRILGALQRRGYSICRHPDCINIVYVEGVDNDGLGTPNDNKPNVFNDLRCVIRIDGNGNPRLQAWEATTEPGRFYTENPEPPGNHLPGAARIAFAQFKSWAVGRHRPGTVEEHEALVQVAPVTVYRDLNKDYQRAGDRTDTGIFGINQHRAHDLPHDNIARSSAGCLVGRLPREHEAFMALAKADARYLANNGYRFSTAILPAVALRETSIDPSILH
jgi:peptidoglycan hydrolase-like protein with peptidoglycan-binding domain